MKIYSKKSKHFMTITLVISFAFLFNLFLTPYVYSQSNELIMKINQSGRMHGMELMVGQEGGASHLIAAPEDNLYMMDGVSYHIMNRSQQESRKLPGLILYTFAVMLVGYGILAFISRYLYRRPKSSLCVMAASLGGHAPPSNYCF